MKKWSEENNVAILRMLFRVRRPKKEKYVEWNEYSNIMGWWYLGKKKGSISEKCLPQILCSKVQKCMKIS